MKNIALYFSIFILILSTKSFAVEATEIIGGKYSPSPFSLLSLDKEVYFTVVQKMDWAKAFMVVPTQSENPVGATFFFSDGKQISHQYLSENSGTEYCYLHISYLKSQNKSWWNQLFDVDIDFSEKGIIYPAVSFNKTKFSIKKFFIDKYKISGNFTYKASFEEHRRMEVFSGEIVCNHDMRTLSKKEMIPKLPKLIKKIELTFKNYLHFYNLSL